MLAIYETDLDTLKMSMSRKEGRKSQGTLAGSRDYRNVIIKCNE